MVILVFPCFPMFFTFSLLLYINWQWIDVSTMHRQVHFEKMLVGNSRNFPFCILQDPFLDYMANIYDYYISISWEYYISFLHYHIYISHNINPILAQHFCCAPRIGGRVATGHRYSRGSRRAPGAMAAAIAMAMASLEQNSQRNLVIYLVNSG